MLIAVALGAGMGVINGVLVAWGRVPSIIVTLGTLAIYRGILVEFSGAKTVTTDSLPAWLVDLPRLNLVHHRRSRHPRDGRAGARHRHRLPARAPATCSFGRRFYAIGSNPDAAELIGLPARRDRLHRLRPLAARSAGLAGFMFLARFGNITVVAGQGLELQVVAAVVVGGVNIFGGSGTVVGAMLGAIMIGTLEQSLFRLQDQRVLARRACSAC